MPPDGFINGALAAEAEQPATSTAAPAAAPPDPYNIQGALKAGYDITEIVDYLGRNGLNVAGARKAGYLDDEIVSHLIGRAPEPEPEPPAKPAEPVSSTLVGAGKALAQVPTDFAGGLIKAGGNIDRAAGTVLQAGARHSGDFASQQLDIIDKIDAGEPFAMPSTGQNSRDQAMNEFGQAYAGSDADTRAAIRQRITGEVAVKPEDTLLSQAGGGLKALGDTIHGAGEAVTGFGERMAPLTQEEQGRFSVQGIKLLGGMAPYAVAALGGPVAVATLAGVQGFSDTYDAAKKAGSSDEDAAAAGLLGGIADAGLMVVPMHQAVRVLDRIPKMFKGEFLKGIIESAKGAGSFVGFAELQKIADNVIAQNTYDPSRPAMQHVGENLGLEAAVGAFLPFAALAGRTGGRLALRGLDRVLPAGPTLDINPDRPPEPPPPRPADVMAAPDLDSAIKTAEQAAGAPTEDAAYDEPTPQAGPASTSTALVTQPTPVDVRSEVDQLSTGDSRDLQQAALLRLFANTGRGAVEQNQDGSYQFRTINEAGDEVTHPIAVYYPSPAAQTAPGPDQRTPVTTEQADVIRQHYGQAGVNVVFYQDHQAIPFDGAVDPNQPNTIFLSSNPQRALVQVAGHEFGHVLTNTTLPDGTSLGDLLHQQISAGLTNAGQKHAERMFGWAAPKRADFDNDADWATAVQAHLINEMGAEIAGEAPKFSSFAGRVIDAVQARWGDGVAADMLRKLMDGLRAAMQSIREMFGGTNTRSRNWVSNIEDVHDTLAKMYAERFGSPLERERAAHETAVDKVERDELVAQPAAEPAAPAKPAGTFDQGDRVITPDGPGTVMGTTTMTIGGKSNTTHLVRLDDGGRGDWSPAQLKAAPAEPTPTDTGLSEPVGTVGTPAKPKKGQIPAAMGGLTATSRGDGFSQADEVEQFNQRVAARPPPPPHPDRSPEAVAAVQAIADRWEHELGNPAMARAIRAGQALPPRPNDPPDASVAFQQGLLDREIAKRGGTAPKPQETFSMDQFMSFKGDTWTRFKAVATDEARELLNAAEAAAQKQTDRINALGWSTEEIGRGSPPAAVKDLKDTLTTLWALSSRFVAGEVAAVRGYKRANPEGFSALTGELRRVIDRINGTSRPDVASWEDVRDGLHGNARQQRRWLDELATERDAAAKATPQARLLQQTEAAILRPVDGNEADLPPAARDRLEQVREKIDEVTHPEADTPPMAKVRGELAKTSEALVQHTTKKGKILTGTVRTDLDQAGAKKLDPFTFKKDGGWFIRQGRGEAPQESTPAATGHPSTHDWSQNVARVLKSEGQGEASAVFNDLVRINELNPAQVENLLAYTRAATGDPKWMPAAGSEQPAGTQRAATPSPESKPEQPRAEQTRPSPESGAEQPQPERPSDYGANNKTFTKEAADKARERLRAKLNRLNAGFDPEMAFDGLVLAGFHIEAGARKFRDYARAMIEDLGNAARPHLAQWYTAVRMQHGFDARGMDDAGAVELWQKGMDARAAALAKPVPGRDVATMPGSQSLVPAPAPVNAPAPVAHNPDHAVAERIATRLDRQHVLKIPPFGARELQNFAEEAHGGTLAQGAYTRDRLYDALELGVNRYIQRNPERFSPAVDAPRAMQTARELADLKQSLPTQTVRAGEKDAYQQFSTPPDYAYAASWVANLQPSDHVLEPSAGVGGLIVHAMNAGVRETTTNELSDKRRGMIALLNPTRVTGEDAAQLHNILPDAVHPTAVMMNPPFSRAAERMGGRMVADEGATHIEQALARLEPGGRLVAIVGDGMKPEGTGPEGGGRQGTGKAFADWWRKIGAEYDVRANVGVDRDIYTKYGTSFPTRFLVIDKNPPSGRPMVTGQVADAAGLIERLKDVRDERSAVQPVADQSGRAEVATGGADVAGPDGELHSSAGGVGPGTEPGGTAATDLGEPADTGRGGTDGAGPAGLGDTAGGSGQPVVPEQSELRPGGSGRPAGGRAGTGRNASRRGGGGSADGIRADGSGERVEPGLTPAPEPVLAVENATAKPDNQAVNEAVYEAYKPQRVQITGAKPHPGALVQSAAMATVLPPATDYRPRLPVSLVKGGALSDAQLEAIVYAGHAHSDVMADGKRRGFFIGDGTGVGKGREIAGIILDNFQNGRKKAIWISEKRGRCSTTRNATGTALTSPPQT
jgi:hypothetical protein